MRQTYATHLTRDYLEFLGITEVTEDGRIFTKNGEVTPYPRKDGYTQIVLYSPTLRQTIAPEERTNTSGQISLCTHRVVYVWFNRIQPDGMIIHHKDKNRANNCISNLELETPKNNIWMDRVHDIREIPCKLNRLRSYYEEKLAKYEVLYATAKENHNANEAHKQRANIAQTKARLRYYDNHKQEVNEMTEYKKDLMELASWKKFFKEQGNKRLWHECITIEKIVKEKGTEAWPVVKHALEVAHEHFKR